MKRRGLTRKSLGQREVVGGAELIEHSDKGIDSETKRYNTKQSKSECEMRSAE